MSEIFVGRCEPRQARYAERNRLLSVTELEALLRNHAAKQTSYFFLRWFHQVSGFISELPDEFNSPEGQLFNKTLEIRWKQVGDKYDVLLLSTAGGESGFVPIGKARGVKQTKAIVYPETETRFPKGIQANGVNIYQRYFFNPHTSTIHFVALTI